MTAKTLVAVLGSGELGAAVAAAVLDSGRTARVWGARQTWYLSVFADMGVRVADSAHEAVRGATAVVLAPHDAPEIEAMTAELDENLVGPTVLIFHEPATDVTGLTAWLSRQEVQHLDCVVFGSNTRLGTSASVIMVTGPPAVVDGERDLLDGFGLVFPIDDTLPRAGRDDELTLTGLWYDINVAIVRALANVTETARPVIEIQLRAVLANISAMARAIDGSADAMRDDVGVALHTRALETVIAARRRAGFVGSELEQAAAAIVALSDDELRSPLIRIAPALRCWGDPVPGSEPR